MRQIRAYFERFVNISDKDWHLFASKLTQVEFDKKSILLKTGQTEAFLSFMERGIVRYYFPRLENDLTFEFGFENEFVSAYDSFLAQEPSSYQVEALTETVLWRVSYEDLQEIYASSEVGNIIGRFAAESLYQKKSKREKSLLKDSAEQRYLKLFSEQPKLIREIPLKYLASYIGITPQALSRIRRRIS